MVLLIICGILAVISWVVAVFVFSESEKSKLGSALVILGLVLCLGGVAGYPYSNVWQKRLAGQAQMAEAEANRQIKVREAQATKDSALLLAEAEVIRATGVKDSNNIIKEGLGGPEGYLRYLFIESLKEASANGNQTIYIATEAGLPILEANRLNHK